MKIKMQNTKTKKVMKERTGFGCIRRPRWKEYTLIKYVDRKEVLREKVWVDESEVFASDGNTSWEPEELETIKKIA